MAWTTTLLILLLGLCACRDSTPSAEIEEIPVPVRPVEVYRVVPRPYEDRASEFGTLTPSETLTLSAQITAEVVQMGFSEGDEVESGQLLYRLDSRDLELRLASQEAALHEARVARAKAQADMDRAQTLLGKGVSTQQFFDDAVFALQAADARIVTLEAERALTRRDLEKTRIVSPGRYKTVSATARVGSLARPGQPMVTLAAVNPLDLVFSIPSHRTGLLREGDSLIVHVEGAAQPVRGRVHDLTFPVPPDQGFVTVRVRVPNPKRTFYPGQTARIDLVVESRDDLVWVPAESVLQRFGAWGVYVVDDGIARFRGIRRGRVSGNFIEAAEGLEFDEPVIVVGQTALAPGDPVDVRAAR